MSFNVDYTKRQKLTTYFRFAINIIRAFFKGISPTKFSFVGANSRLSGFANVHGRFANIGANVTIDLHRLRKVSIGERFSLGDYSKISSCGSITSSLSGMLTIGNNVGISEFFCLYVRGNVCIGNDVIIGPRVVIVSENHEVSGKLPIRELGLTRDGVKINEGTWIGAGVIILDGVEIGKNCVIAAGAVVTKNVLDYTIIAGVPAKQIGVRK